MKGGRSLTIGTAIATIIVAVLAEVAPDLGITQETVLPLVLVFITTGGFGYLSSKSKRETAAKEHEIEAKVAQSIKDKG